MPKSASRSARWLEVDRALLGEHIFGDDFNQEEIDHWYQDEAEAYANLGSGDRASYVYGYNALNSFHGFQHLPSGPLGTVLGFGGAYGDELEPILARVQNVVIVDPSDAFRVDAVGGVPARFVKPRSDGRLELEDSSVDLVTCFGVLHHIPNVSFVLGELSRVTRPGGRLLIREPIVSMGDWRHVRKGLTPHERGIPRQLLERAVRGAGCIIERSTLCDFSLTPRLFAWLGANPYNRKPVIKVDAWLARMSSRMMRYHAERAVHKLRPSSVFLLARRM